MVFVVKLKLFNTVTVPAQPKPLMLSVNTVFGASFNLNSDHYGNALLRSIFFCSWRNAVHTLRIKCNFRSCSLTRIPTLERGKIKAIKQEHLFIALHVFHF